MKSNHLAKVKIIFEIQACIMILQMLKFLILQFWKGILYKVNYKFNPMIEFIEKINIYENSSLNFNSNV